MTVEPELMTFHFPVMLGAAAALCVVMMIFSGKKVSRAGGIGLLVGYGAYAGLLVLLTRGETA